MMTAKSTFLAVILAVAGIAAAFPAKAQEAPALPGGASSLQETHGDWQVTCQMVDGSKQCAISQQQQQNGQRVLVIEIQSQEGDSATGVAVLPFGLKLQAGASFQVDEAQALPVMPFSTCLPAGCLVPVAFDAATIKLMREGEALKLKAASLDEQEVLFTISLKGFTSALDRQASL